MDLFWVLVVVQSIIFGGFCAFIARQKNRDGVNWFLLGALFSIFAILALIAIPAIPKAQARSLPNSNLKSCPFCAEKIQQAAVKCRYCQSDLVGGTAVTRAEGDWHGPVNSYGPEGRTRLMNAVLDGDIENVKLLLSQGADVSLKDENFGTSTAIDIAHRVLASAQLAEERSRRQEILDALVPARSGEGNPGVLPSHS